MSDDKAPDYLHSHDDELEFVFVPPGARVIMHQSADPELQRLIAEVKSGIRAQREAEEAEDGI